MLHWPFLKLSPDSTCKSSCRSGNSGLFFIYLKISRGWGLFLWVLIAASHREDGQSWFKGQG